MADKYIELMKSQEVRKQFLNFFKEREHKIVPSAPMVLKDDPTLMFTNAGMNQFKAYFLGTSHPSSQRVVDTQKCLRVSGKHNDLEEVGKDTYHHTMFEMLGNWSFGIDQEGGNGYFKKEAIEWAWEFLTDVCGIDKDSMYVTVFEGSNDQDALEEDKEAKKLWSALVPESQILYGNKKDNFWEMGDQGPCGPCSEIHVDIRSAEEKAKVPGAELVNRDHPQVIEIWNLVFIQFNRKADGRLEKLPAVHVDTGMGFERLCMVLQGVQSNYDTDVFKPLIAEIEKITATTYGSKEETDIAIRVVADHIRAIAFSIADGQLPSNTGAGYVIRRILRRAVRYGFTFLGSKEPFMYQLVKVMVGQMGDAFPELKNQAQLIENVIKEEEQSFLNTLDQGLGLLDRLMSESKNNTLSGEKAFELYDTFGFPIDLTALILSENKMELDQEGFDVAMKAQKDRSRKASEVSKEDWTVLFEDKDQEFVGYDYLEADVKIAKYRKVSSKKDGDLYQLVFNMTPFYAEGGGQVGDKGVLESETGEVIMILDTKRENDEIVHFTKKLPEYLDSSFNAVVDEVARMQTARNHTATHLLHQALRTVLGTHVEQKGSAVQSKNLRFDFSHFSKVTDEQLAEVEALVNEKIKEAIALDEGRNIPLAEAKKQGAMALFGEKYGDAVRTIRFGSSIELCGGTHVQNTSELWSFKISSESAVAAGIRRIEAITGDAVRTYFNESLSELEAVKQQLGNQKNVVTSVEQLISENQELKKQIESFKKEKALSVASDLEAAFESINGVQFLAQELELDAAAIKDLSFKLAADKKDAFILFGANNDGKALLSCYISKELVEAKGLNAGTIVRELGKFIQGGGGGQAFFATAGGKNPQGIAKALEEAVKFIG
jgi:alanyl-tRNA synthetase